MTPVTLELRPEDLLLASFARLDLDTQSRANIERCLAQGLDWDYVLQQAELHKICGLLCHHLDTLGRRDIPPKVLPFLREKRDAYVKRSGQLLQKLGNALDRFAQAELPVIVMRGPHLVDLVYHDLALRPFNDIDLLVRLEHLAAADRLLRGMGLREDSEMREFHHLTYHWPAGKIEVHWEPIERSIWSDLSHNSLLQGGIFWANILPTVDVDALWSSPMEFTLDGRQVFGLALEDLLMDDCLHWSIHHFTYRPHGVSFISMCDVAELVKQLGDRIDWPQVVQKARAYRVRTYMYYPLLFAVDLLGCPVPHSVLDQLKPDPSIATVLEVIFRDYSLPLPGPKNWQIEKVYHMLCIDSAEREHSLIMGEKISSVSCPSCGANVLLNRKPFPLDDVRAVKNAPAVLSCPHCHTELAQYEL